MSETPKCPLMSTGNNISQICLQDECAWYLKAYKTCSVHVLAHNAALEIKKKQSGEK